VHEEKEEEHNGRYKEKQGTETQHSLEFQNAHFIGKLVVALCPYEASFVL